MTAERVRSREAARLSTYARLREALTQLLPQGSRVWIFGSVVKKGKFREDSDVDVAIETLPPGISEAQLQNALALRLDRAVDVLKLDETRLRPRIENEGELWTL